MVIQSMYVVLYLEDNTSVHVPILWQYCDLGSRNGLYICYASSETKTSPRTTPSIIHGFACSSFHKIRMSAMLECLSSLRLQRNCSYMSHTAKLHKCWCMKDSQKEKSPHRN